MDTAQKHRSLELAEKRYCFWRLSEDEYEQLRQNSLPIKIDGFLLLDLWLAERYNPERLTLPKALITLEYLFGKSSDWFDTWKGSFSFPLLLRLTKPDGQFVYLFRIEDVRGTLEFRLYRFLESGTDGYDISVYQQPLETEFSREEIHRFICYLYGYLVGLAEGVSLLPQQPFLKQVNSQRLLYGYDKGDFFEWQIDSEAEYQAAIEQFEQKHPSLHHVQQVESLRSLVEVITGETSHN
jgi:hypothetical protein